MALTDRGEHLVELAGVSDALGKSVAYQKSSAPQVKIFQAHHGWGMLLQLPGAESSSASSSGGLEQPPNLCILFGETIATLTPTERTTTECVYLHAKRRSAKGSASTAFDQQTRAAKTDSAISNLSGERLYARRENHASSLLHLDCDMHEFANGLGVVFDLASTQSSELYHLAQSVQPGGYTPKFKKSGWRR